MSAEGPYVVVAAMANGAWTRLALSPGRNPRLLVFDEAEIALRFALGLSDGGVQITTVGNFDEGDETIATVLERHDAEPPCSFEHELLDAFERSDWPEAAYLFGRIVGGELVAAYGLTHPN